MKRGNNRNIFIGVSLIFLLIIFAYTFDYIKLIILTLETPQGTDISSFLGDHSFSLISSLLYSINKIIPLLQTKMDFYLVLSMIFQIVKAFTIKEVAILIFILVITFIKYDDPESELTSFLSTIIKAMEGLIIVLLVSCFLVFYITLIESGFDWLDSLTFKIIIVTILAISSSIIFILGCATMYQPLKKRIYANPPN